MKDNFIEVEATKTKVIKSRGHSDSYEDTDYLTIINKNFIERIELYGITKYLSPLTDSTRREHLWKVNIKMNDEWISDKKEYDNKKEIFEKYLN